MNEMVKQPEPSGMMATATTRAAQEVQAAMVIAKKFPRDQTLAFSRIMKACERRSLAEAATYTYPRGGTMVTGPSIRLAEVLRTCWGNIDSGVVELEQRDGESIVMAYAWDLESNTRDVKVFTVPHERRVGKGDKARIERLEDPRDIYEMVANQASRRKRSCVLSVIPADVVEAATDRCEKTLRDNAGEPLEDRIRKAVVAFQDFGVTQTMIEDRLGHVIAATTEAELITLRKIFTSLKDGMASREDYFQLERKENLVKETKQDEPELAAMGLAPMQTAAEMVEPAKPKPKSEYQEKLAEVVVGAGFTFDDLLQWGIASGNIDADNPPSEFSELKDQQAKRFYMAKGTLLKQLAQLKGKVMWTAS